jgi:hypothetical protein
MTTDPRPIEAAKARQPGFLNDLFGHAAVPHVRQRKPQHRAVVALVSAGIGALQATRDDYSPNSDAPTMGTVLSSHSFRLQPSR